MNPAFFVSFGLGTVAVLQAALNRRIATSFGLAPAIALNAVIVLLAAAGFLFAASRGWINAMGPQTSFREIRLFWLIPGFFGFAIIAGLPWAIARIGALNVFVTVVAAQMVVSTAWDAIIEGVELSWTRVVGGLLAVAGAILASR